MGPPSAPPLCCSASFATRRLPLESHASMSTFPVRSLEECHRMMTSPGTPWEMEEKEIRGNRLRVYKNVWPSMRFMWQTTKVCRYVHRFEAGIYS